MTASRVLYQYLRIVEISRYEVLNFYSGPRPFLNYTCVAKFCMTSLYTDTEPGCFHELQHALREYPSLVVVRTKLKGQSEFNGFMSDAVGKTYVIRMLPRI